MDTNSADRDAKSTAEGNAIILGVGGLILLGILHSLYPDETPTQLINRAARMIFGRDLIPPPDTSKIPTLTCEKNPTICHSESEVTFHDIHVEGDK